MEQVLDTLREWGTLYGMRIIGAILILVIGRIVVSFLMAMIKRLMSKANAEETVSKFVITIAKIALMMFVILAALNTLGVETASIIAVIGAAGNKFSV